MLETSQSGILEGELETDLRKTVQMGCLDIIKPSERTALAFYSTEVLRGALKLRYLELRKNIVELS